MPSTVFLKIVVAACGKYVSEPQNKCCHGLDENLHFVHFWAGCGQFCLTTF